MKREEKPKTKKGKGISYWLVIRHWRGLNSQEAKVGPMSIKDLRRLRKQHRQEIHGALKCALGVERHASHG